MTAPIQIRHGQSTDEVVVLAMWDKAIRWMAERGQAHQWGATPASQQQRHRQMVREWVLGGGPRIAESDGQAAGASVIVGEPPSHVPPTTLRETYLLFLISDRDHAGRGIGSRLVRRAASDAQDNGSEVLRVDCWADAPELVAWYERQGFVRSERFTVDVRGGWNGQVLEMTL